MHFYLFNDYRSFSTIQVADLDSGMTDQYDNAKN